MWFKCEICEKDLCALCIGLPSDLAKRLSSEIARTARLSATMILRCGTCSKLYEKVSAQYEARHHKLEKATEALADHVARLESTVATKLVAGSSIAPASLRSYVSDVIEQSKRANCVIVHGLSENTNAAPFVAQCCDAVGLVSDSTDSTIVAVDRISSASATTVRASAHPVRVRFAKLADRNKFLAAFRQKCASLTPAAPSAKERVRCSPDLTYMQRQDEKRLRAAFERFKVSSPGRAADFYIDFRSREFRSRTHSAVFSADEFLAPVHSAVPPPAATAAPSTSARAGRLVVRNGGSRNDGNGVATRAGRRARSQAASALNGAAAASPIDDSPASSPTN